MKSRRSESTLFNFLLVITIIIGGFTIYRAKVIIDLNIKNQEQAKAYQETIYREKASDEEKETIKDSILLVNKENAMSPDYIPDNIVELNTPFISNGNPNVNKMTKVAADALKELFDGAQKDSIYLLVVSGYRDYNYQKYLYEKEVEVFGQNKASMYVAKPGTSEHQTGLAVDILSEDHQTLDKGFEDTSAYRWVEENCADYGFIIRYPKGKEDVTGYGYEPWHLRYVGVDVAKDIVSKGITLEEYLDE